MKNSTFAKITGTLTNTEPIGVTMQTPGVFTSSSDTSYNDASKFTSDYAGYEVHQNASGQLELRIPPAASVTSGGTTTEYTAFADAVSAWNSAANGATLTLLGDVTTASTVNVSGTKTLDLNGFGIRASGTGYSVIAVSEGADLTVNDSDNTRAHAITLDHYRGTFVTDGTGTTSVTDGSGTAYITGGYVTGASIAHSYYDDYQYGGGFSVYSRLTLNGGTVIGNYAADNGGGILVNGTFELNGSTISYNYGGNGGGMRSRGAVTLTSGFVSNNKSWDGGGVLATNGTFTLAGATVSSNVLNGVGAAGIHVWDSVTTFRITGGAVTDNVNTGSDGVAGICAQQNVSLSGNVTIRDNCETSNGAVRNLYLNGASINMDGALGANASIGVFMDSPSVFTSSTDTSLNDAGKFTSDNAGYEVHKNASGQLELRVPPAASVTSGGTTTEYTAFADAVSAWNSAANGATLTLLSDVTTASTVNVSGTKTLDLNGCGIRITTKYSSVVNVPSGATLTLNDSNPDAPHKYKIASPAANGAGLATVDDVNGTTAFTGGYLTGSDGDPSNWLYGGGVQVKGTLHFKGGTLIGNNAYTGSGIAFRSGSSGTMSGTAAIIGNYMHGEYGNGAGICLENGVTSFTMSGGTIRYNRGEINANWPDHAGGIGADGNTTAVISGGTISDNFGIGLRGSARISGDVIITNNMNTSSTINNYWPNGKTLIIDGALGENASIGVTFATFNSNARRMDPTSGVFTSSADTSLNDVSKFTSDYAGYVVGKNTSGQLLVATPVTVTFDANGHGTAPTAQSVASGGVVTEPDAPTDDNYTFGGWYKEAACSTAWDFAATAVTQAATLYAKWTPNACTVTFDSNGGGALDPITQAYGSTVTLSDIPSQPTNHPDYAFSLWNTAADGTGTPYASDASFTLTADLTLYAQWTDKPIYTVSGTVTLDDNPVSGVTVRLVQGERKLAVTQTDGVGKYSFSAPEGTYNIVAEFGSKTKTALVTLSGEQAVELALPAGSVNSVLTVTGSETPNVVVGGLDAVAAVVDTQDPVTVTMTVEQKEADEAAGAGEIQDEAGEYQTVDFLSIEIEMQVGSSVGAVPDTGEVVLEIIVPYSFSGKENVEVYRYHDAAAALEVLDSRPAGDYEDGTCYLDRDNGLVYIYASRFSTYAIGYTQCYNITGAIRYGSYTGSVTVSLEDGDGTPVKQMTISLSEGAANYSFTHVLAGKYYLNATWSEGNEQILPEREILVQ